MRVTYGMMLNGASQWMSARSEQLYRAETVAATGQRVNSPSEDPAAVGRILEDRATISEYGQYQSNIDQARTWIAVGAETLEAAIEWLNLAADMAQEQITWSWEDKNEILSKLESYYEQMIGLADTKYLEGYMYSGAGIDTRPFYNMTTVSGGAAEAVVFGLSAAASEVTIEITDADGEIVRTLSLAGGVAGTNTTAWDGLDNLGNPVPDGDYTFSVTAEDASGQGVASWPAYRGGSSSMRIVAGESSVLDLNHDGGEIFEGALRAMSEAVLAVAEENEAAAATALESLTAAMETVELEVVKLAAVNDRLDRAEERLDALALNVETRLNGMEAADPEQAVIELQSVENAYEVTTETVAMIMQLPRLMDYL